MERRGENDPADPADSVFHGAGLRVSTLKRAHHSFDVDVPGKDLWVHRQSGATEVLISVRPPLGTPA